MDRSTSLGDGGNVQPGEVEPDWKDQGQDQGDTDRGEQEGDGTHAVRCDLTCKVSSGKYQTTRHVEPSLNSDCDSVCMPV